MKARSFLTVCFCCALLLIQCGCSTTNPPTRTLASPKDLENRPITGTSISGVERPPGFQQPPTYRWAPKTTSDPWQLKEEMIRQRNYAAADQLAEQLRKPKPPRSPINVLDPILVTTVADVDFLERSSAFGRITGEQVASRLAQWGFNVIEVKLRDKLYVQTGTGEFILSRDVEQIAQQNDAVVVVTGTYAVGKMENMISLRAIELATRGIIASFDYAVPNVPRLFPNPRIVY